MHEQQESTMKQMMKQTLQEDSFLRNAQADNDLLQQTVDLLIERGWVDPYDDQYLFIHDETNFYPGNEQKLIDLIVGIL